MRVTIQEAEQFELVRKTFEEQDRWRSKEFLASGSEGRALKVINVEDLSRTVRCAKISKWRAGDSMYQEALIQEKAAARGLSPEIFEVGRDYMVMELIQGMDLYDWMGESHRPSVWLEMGLGVIALAEALESAGTVHGDLGEGNILLTNEGLVAIDFGTHSFSATRSVMFRRAVWIAAVCVKRSYEEQYGAEYEKHMPQDFDELVNLKPAEHKRLLHGLLQRFQTK